MTMPTPDRAQGQLELWGGLECTMNRVQDQYFSQLEPNGHAGRPHDLVRFASLGIKMIRYPVLWERIAPDGIDKADWRWTERLLQLSKLGVEPIADTYDGAHPPVGGDQCQRLPAGGRGRA
jgi:dTDP-4-dehydrorhamnose reductase